MTAEYMVVVISTIVYRMTVILVGAFCIWLGYKLFRLGIPEKAGDIDGKVGDASLSLKRAAPGTVFAVFGAVVIMVCVIRGQSFSYTALPEGTEVQPVGAQPASMNNKEKPLGLHVGSCI